jgi:hypothetical protein
MSADPRTGALSQPSTGVTPVKAGICGDAGAT